MRRASDPTYSLPSEAENAPFQGHLATTPAGGP